MGVRLFDRLASGLALTTAGSELIEVAEQVERDVSRLSRGASARDTRLGGSLTVTAPPLLAHYLLMPMIAAFSSRYPQVEVALLANDELASLNRREADVAIRATVAPQDTLVGQRLAAVRNGLFCTRAYLQSKGLGAEQPAAREDLDWIWHDKGQGQPAWAASYFSAGRVACKVDSKLAAVSAALADMGVVELPVIVASTIADLVQLPDLAVKSDRDVWILYHRDFKHTARVRAFVGDIRNQFSVLA